MQPSWLENWTQKWIYRIGVGLIAGLFAELTGGLICGLTVGMLTIMLILGLAVGLTCWLGVIIAGSSEQIELFETLNFSWSWQKARKFIAPVMSVAASLWLLVSIVVLEGSYRSIFDLIIGLINPLIFGLIIVLISGLSSSTIESRRLANQGIRRSATNATFFALINLSITLIATTIPENDVPVQIFALVLGFVGLWFGGLACIQHFTLRVILWCNGYIPWNYDRFLNYATKRGLLQQVGGRYRFVHKLLQEQFAKLQLPPPQISRPSRNSRIKLAIASFCGAILLLLALSLPYFAPNTIWVASTSMGAMIPTLQNNERLMVDQHMYRSHNLQRGDLVRFTVSDDMRKQGFYHYYYLRRVIGFPGEIIEAKGGQVYINSQPLQEDYINRSATFEYKSVRVPANSYLVLGDNRNYGESDFGGLVPQDHIRGRITFRYWPPHRIGRID